TVRLKRQMSFVTDGIGHGWCRRHIAIASRRIGGRTPHPHGPDHPWRGNAALQRRKVSSACPGFRSRVPKSNAFDLSAQYEMIAYLVRRPGRSVQHMFQRYVTLPAGPTFRCGDGWGEGPLYARETQG